MEPKSKGFSFSVLVCIRMSFMTGREGRERSNQLKLVIVGQIKNRYINPTQTKWQVWYMNHPVTVNPE